MAILTGKNFRADVDDPKRIIDIQQRILAEAVKDKFEVKSTTLSRLHGIKTEVIYYEQIISNRQGNLANTASLNKFDPNITRFRRITDFVILTADLDADLDKDVFTDVTFKGLCKVLPNTIIPNIGDYFIMKVFNAQHIFKVVELNSTPIEKDSGYEIGYTLYQQDVIPQNVRLNECVKEDYTFDYNHVGTDFRTILRNDEYEFIQNSRNVIFDVTKEYLNIFYHKTLNTIMCATENMTINLNNTIRNTVFAKHRSMIGATTSECRTIYDQHIVSFINKNNVLSSSEYVSSLTNHMKFDKHCYLSSIFSAIEHRDISKFTKHFSSLEYAETCLFNATSQIYGRFILNYVDDNFPKNDYSFVDFFPSNFTTKLTTYNSDLMYNSIPVYTNVNDAFIDIISVYINEKKDDRRIAIIVKLLNIVMNKHINYIYGDNFDDSYVLFYTYPLVIYVLKYMAREISLVEYK